MQHATPLRVPLRVLPIQVEIEAALVAVAPEQDGWVIHVARDHGSHQLCAYGGVVGVLPAAQLVQHVQAQLVASLQEVLIRRVVRHAHGVHVHVLHQVHVSAADGLAQRAAGVRPEGVAVATLKQDPRSVHVETVAWAHLDGAEAEALVHAVQDTAFFFQHHRHPVQVRRLSRPVPLAPDRGLQTYGGRAGRHGRAEVRSQPFDASHHTVSFAGEMHIHAEAAVHPCVDGGALNVVGRHGLQVHRPENATEVPVIAAPLRAVDAGVHRRFGDRDFEQVGAAVPQLGADVVGEAVESATMARSNGLPVEPCLGVGHGALKDQAHHAAAPVRWNSECGPVFALFRVRIGGVTVRAKALQLPARGHRDVGQDATEAARGAEEGPGDGVVLTLA